jgi:hypothetical protein
MRTGDVATSCQLVSSKAHKLAAFGYGKVFLSDFATSDALYC